MVSADLVQSALSLISGIPLAAGSAVCLMDPGDFTVMLVGQTLKGISSIPGAYIMMALFADVLDHLEAKLGYRVDGITMSVYNTIITVINGLAIAFFNFFYDSAWFAQADVVEFFFLKYEISNAALIVILSFLTVEKHIKEEQELIRTRKNLRTRRMKYG